MLILTGELQSTTKHKLTRLALKAAWLGLPTVFFMSSNIALFSYGIHIILSYTLAKVLRSLRCKFTLVLVYSLFNISIRFVPRIGSLCSVESYVHSGDRFDLAY